MVCAVLDLTLAKSITGHNHMALDTTGDIVALYDYETNLTHYSYQSDLSNLIGTVVCVLCSK